MRGRPRARFITGNREAANDGFGRRRRPTPRSARPTKQARIIDLDDLWMIRCDCGWHDTASTASAAQRIASGHTHARRRRASR